DRDRLAGAVERERVGAVGVRDLRGIIRDRVAGAGERLERGMRAAAPALVGLEAVHAADGGGEVGGDGGRGDRGGVFGAVVDDAGEGGLENAGEVGDGAAGENGEVVGVGARDGEAFRLQPAHHAIVIGGEGEVTGLHLLGRDEVAVREARLEFGEVAHGEGDLDRGFGGGLLREELAARDVGAVGAAGGVGRRSGHGGDADPLAGGGGWRGGAGGKGEGREEGRHE